MWLLNMPHKILRMAIMRRVFRSNMAMKMVSTIIKGHGEFCGSQTIDQIFF